VGWLAEIALGAGVALTVARAVVPGGPAPIPADDRAGIHLASFSAEGVTARGLGVELRAWRLRSEYRRFLGARVGPPTGLELSEVHARWARPAGAIEVIAERARPHARGLELETSHVRLGDDVVSADKALWDTQAERLFVAAGRRPDGRRTAPATFTLR
jgi:hypothetical protein